MNILLADFAKLRPTHVGIVFDKGGKVNWRKEIYPEYKANRRPDIDTLPPEKRKAAREKLKQYLEMKGQIDPLKELLRSMGFRLINKAGVEADDLMGTLAREYSALGFEVVMCSNDKDMAQLVDGQIKMMNGQREILGPNEVFKKFGVRPTQIVDYLSLLGDTADNIIGLRGVGEKKAAQLLSDFGSIKSIIERCDELTPALCASFKGAKKAMKLNRQLITLRLDEPHKVKIEQLVYPPVDTYDTKDVGRICKELGLTQTHKQIQGMVNQWSGMPEQQQQDSAPKKGAPPKKKKVLDSDADLWR